MLSVPTEEWLVGSQHCPKPCTYLEGGKDHEELTDWLFPTAENLRRGLRISYSCPGGLRRAEVGVQDQACMDVCETTTVHPAAPGAWLRCPLGAMASSSFCPRSQENVSQLMPALTAPQKVQPPLSPLKLSQSPIPAAGGKFWGMLHLPPAVVSQRAVSWLVSLTTGDHTDRLSLQGTCGCIKTERLRPVGFVPSNSLQGCEKLTNAAAAVYHTSREPQPSLCNSETGHWLSSP